MVVTTGLPPGIAVLERGWLSSNNVLLKPAGGGDAVLIDTGYVAHAAQTVELVRHALGGSRLARIINTHLHSDHCGGNAAVSAAFGAPISIPPGQWDAVRRWDEDVLTYRPTGQRCARFDATNRIAPGDRFEVGEDVWRVLAAPGHDPHSIALYCESLQTLISADALWEDGFGIVFPELEGVAAFDEVEQVLDVMSGLAVRWVIPGHGPPFTDAAGAISRARSRLATFRADPRRHAQHASKALLMFRMLELRRGETAAVIGWLIGTPYFSLVRERYFGEVEPAVWAHSIVDQLVRAGHLAKHENVLAVPTRHDS